MDWFGERHLTILNDMPYERGAQIAFESIRKPRAHEYVAEQLRRQIDLRFVGPGSALPAERVLAQRLGVSRSTIQQAMLILEQEGAVERRRGRHGGTFVVHRADNDGVISRRKRQAIERNREDILEALEFRLEVEPAAAGQAASRAHSAEVNAVRRVQAAVRTATDDVTLMRSDTAFHLGIARATHNRFYVESIERVHVVLSDVIAALPESDLWWQRSHRQHEAIFAAILARDKSAARRRMKSHVSGTDAAVRTLLAAL